MSAPMPEFDNIFSAFFGQGRARTEREQQQVSAVEELLGALRDRRAARHELGRLVTTPNAQDQSAYGLAVECAQKADTRVKVAVENLEALL